MNNRSRSIKNIVMIGIIFIMMIMGSSCAKVVMPEELISGVEERSNYSEIIERLAAEGKIITIAVDQEESSFREINLMGDNDKEVVVLAKYKNSLDESDTYYELQIYKYKNDRWNKLTNASIGNIADKKDTSISKVEFMDITADGYPEIFVTSVCDETGENVLNVYSYHGGYFQNLYSDFIGDYEIFDINSDEKQEIILVKNEDDYNYLNVLSFDGLKLTETYRADIEMYANSLKLKAGKVDSERNGIYIYGENRYFSEDLILLIYDGKVKQNGKSNENVMTFNKIFLGNSEELVNIISIEDINKDEILDIGCLRQSAELWDYENKIEGLEQYIPKSIRIWYTYNLYGNYSIVRREYVNKELNFKIILPNKMRSSIAIVEEKELNKENQHGQNEESFKWENKISFYDIGKETPEKILCIIIHKNEEFVEKDSEIIKLGKNQLYYYSGSIPKSVYDKGDMSKEYIKDMFKIIDRKGAELDEE